MDLQNASYNYKMPNTLEVLECLEELCIMIHWFLPRVTPVSISQMHCTMFCGTDLLFPKKKLPLTSLMMISF